MTNAEKIRSMSDEELAEMFRREWSGCPTGGERNCPNCKLCWLEWLKKEVDDE